MRNDIHSPKNIVTEDYEFVTICTFEPDFGTIGLEAFIDHRKQTGGQFSTHSHGGNCMVCGAYMKDYAIFFHMPTNEYIRTGCDCAAHIESGHTDAFRRVAQLRRAAKARSEAMQAITEALDSAGILEQVEGYFHEGELGGPIFGFNIENKYEKEYEDSQYNLEINFKKISDLYAREKERPLFGDVVDDLPVFMIERAKAEVFIIADIIRNCVKYKSAPSEKQLNFMKNLCSRLSDLKNKAFKFKEERENAEDAPEGKTTIRGSILSVKAKEDAYGISIKMVVKDDRGFKVWCTRPTAIREANKGDRVEFNVTLKPSPDDPKFAFGTRPSKARIL